MGSLIKQKKLHSNFYFFENIKHRDICHFYKSIDIFLFTSLFEGSPNVIPEAMANGLPIISSDIPATKNLLRDNKNAILCDPKKLREFTDSVEKLLLNPELAKEMGDENSLTVNVDKNNKRIKEILQDIFGELRD